MALYIVNKKKESKKEQKKEEREKKISFLYFCIKMRKMWKSLSFDIKATKIKK